MYDQADAARRRIIARCAEAEALGARYVELANMLMTAPDTPLRTSALKRLADSCDSAVALLEKVRQSRGNYSGNQRPPGQTNG